MHAIAIGATEWLVEAFAAAPHSPPLQAAVRSLLSQYNFTTNLERFGVYAPEDEETNAQPPTNNPDETAEPGGGEGGRGGGGKGGGGRGEGTAAAASAPPASSNNSTTDVVAEETSAEYLGSVWSHLLLPQLKVTHALLAEAVAIITNRANCVATERGAKATEDEAAEEKRCVARHPLHPKGGPVPRQDAAMPALAAQFDFTEAVHAHQSEQVYLHALSLVGTGLDPLFGEALDMIAVDMWGVEVVRMDSSDVGCKGGAEIKSFARMAARMVVGPDAELSGQHPKPRPAANLDIVRRLVVVETPEQGRAVVHAIARRFGGVSALWYQDDAEGDGSDDGGGSVGGEGRALGTQQQQQQLQGTTPLVVLNVEFLPDATTIGALFRNPMAESAWEERRANRPSSVAGEQWRRDHDAALKVLQQCDEAVQLAQHCQVQVVLKEAAELVNVMASIAQIVQAGSGAALHAELVQPPTEPVDGTDLIVAAQAGRIATVERVLSNGKHWSAATPFLDLNRPAEWDTGGPTALYYASHNGHLPVVHALLNARADPTVARSDDGTTPVWIGAQQGHVEVVAALLAANADPAVPRSEDGTTPLAIAATNGHLQVLRALLAANACPSTATTSGVSPAAIAKLMGHVQCAAVLLEGAQ
jgi:hypothetical protein